MIIIELKTWNGNGTIEKIETKAVTRWKNTMDVEFYYFGFENLAEVKMFLDDRKNEKLIKTLESLGRENYKYCEEITAMIYVDRKATEENREHAKEIMDKYYKLV